MHICVSTLCLREIGREGVFVCVEGGCERERENERFPFVSREEKKNICTYVANCFAVLSTNTHTGAHMRVCVCVCAHAYMFVEEKIVFSADENCLMLLCAFSAYDLTVGLRKAFWSFYLGLTVICLDCVVPKCADLILWFILCVRVWVCVSFLLSFFLFFFFWQLSRITEIDCLGSLLFLNLTGGINNPWNPWGVALCLSMSECMCMHMGKCVSVCVHLYTYIYIYIYIQYVLLITRPVIIEYAYNEGNLLVPNAPVLYNH